MAEIAQCVDAVAVQLNRSPEALRRALDLISRLVPYLCREISLTCRQPRSTEIVPEVRAIRTRFDGSPQQFTSLADISTLQGNHPEIMPSPGMTRVNIQHATVQRFGFGQLSAAMPCNSGFVKTGHKSILKEPAVN